MFFLLLPADFLYIFTELAQNRRLPLSFAALRCIITSFGRTFLPANEYTSEQTVPLNDLGRVSG